MVAMQLRVCVCVCVCALAAELRVSVLGLASTNERLVAHPRYNMPFSGFVWK